MVLNESLETLNDLARDIQKTITKLKLYFYQADKNIKDKRYIKAYKKELDLESELRSLSTFLVKHKHTAEIEMHKSIESASKEVLFTKCKKIEDMFQQDAENEIEDFGEE